MPGTVDAIDGKVQKLKNRIARIDKIGRDERI